MASPSNDDVSLLIGGKVHSQWTAYSIDSDLLVAAHAWEVRLAKPAGKMPANIVKGAAVEVKVGGETVLVGYVDQVRRRTAKNEKSLTISGRDYAAILRDCSAPIFTAKQVTLAEVIAAKPSAPWDAKYARGGVAPDRFVEGVYASLAH